MVPAARLRGIAREPRLGRRLRRFREAAMIKLKGIGHVNLRVGDEAVSKAFYRDILGFLIAEEDPEHGGVFMTLGDNFHTLDIRGHDNPASAQRPVRGQIGLGHIAFEVHSYATLRDAYMHLVRNGVEILRATNHVNQRSFISPTRTGTRSKSITSCPTRWSCSRAVAATMTRRCRSAGRTIRCRPGWSRIGPARR
jgi:catechol 2,3-dioxygenase-like lactoylglutathione lyase family enzyme